MTPKGKQAYFDYDATDKQFLSEQFQKALVKENLTAAAAGRLLGIRPPAPSIVTSGDLEKFKRVSSKVWHRLDEWYSSEKPLKQSRWPEIQYEKRRKKGEDTQNPNGHSHSLDEIISLVYNGMRAAMKYGVPEKNWKQFVIEEYVKPKLKK